ncbi:MAG: hypothetical protein KGL39_35235 [Patescibacteria group bacterium]|nr:hypothetical protein [Patescibacteria group bacterium]
MTDAKPQIRVTVEALETGEKETQEVADDYVIICAGSAFLHHVNEYPNTGTVVLTIKNDHKRRGE